MKTIDEVKVYEGMADFIQNKGSQLPDDECYVFRALDGYYVEEANHQVICRCASEALAVRVASLIMKNKATETVSLPQEASKPEVHAEIAPESHQALVGAERCLCGHARKHHHRDGSCLSMTGEGVSRFCKCNKFKKQDSL